MENVIDILSSIDTDIDSIPDLRFSENMTCLKLSDNVSLYIRSSENNNFCEVEIKDKSWGTFSIVQEVLEISKSHIEYKIDCDFLNIHEIFKAKYNSIGSFKYLFYKSDSVLKDITKILNNMFSRLYYNIESGVVLTTDFGENISSSDNPCVDYLMVDIGIYIVVRAGLVYLIFRVNNDKTCSLVAVNKFSDKWLLSSDSKSRFTFRSHHIPSDEDCVFELSYFRNNCLSYEQENIFDVVRGIFRFTDILNIFIDKVYGNQNKFVDISKVFSRESIRFYSRFSGIDFSYKSILDDVIYIDNRFLDCTSKFYNIVVDYLSNVDDLVDTKNRVRAKIAGYSGGRLKSISILDDFSISIKDDFKMR